MANGKVSRLQAHDHFKERYALTSQNQDWLRLLADLAEDRG